MPCRMARPHRPMSRSSAQPNNSAPPAGQDDITLAELGEWELIRRLGAFAPPGQFDDDAALLEPGRDPTPLVVNSDVLVEGVHFSDATTEAADVGWRAAAANLSDLAAMGATEVVGLTVGLVAPATTRWRWVEAVYEGIQEALQVHGGVLLGGDCSGGSQRLLAVTAIGRLRSDAGAIRRSDGRPGDLLVSTGVHGLSRLGLALLRHEPIAMAAGQPIPSPGSALGQRAIQAHCRPVPRFDAVCELIATRPRDVPWRVGGCDSSDGLAAAVAAIARASGCQAILVRDALPLDPAMAGLPDAETWCLQGGEDFELVLALPPPWARALIEQLPGAKVVGELSDGDSGRLVWSSGRPLIEAGSGAPGYSHFS